MAKTPKLYKLELTDDEQRFIAEASQRSPDALDRMSVKDLHKSFQEYTMQMPEGEYDTRTRALVNLVKRYALLADRKGDRQKLLTLAHKIESSKTSPRGQRAAAGLKTLLGKARHQQRMTGAGAMANVQAQALRRPPGPLQPKHPGPKGLPVPQTTARKQTTIPVGEIARNVAAVQSLKRPRPTVKREPVHHLKVNPRQVVRAAKKIVKTPKLRTGNVQLKQPPSKLPATPRLRKTLGR